MSAVHPSSPVLAPCCPRRKGLMCSMLDLMENKTFLEKLKFGIGDGNHSIISPGGSAPA